MSYYLTLIFATSLVARIATVSSVDANSECIFDSFPPMRSSYATYESIEIEKIDLALMKSGKEGILNV